MRGRFGAELLWLSFDLHPEYPPEGIPREQLVARYGEHFHDRVREMFEGAGLRYNPPPDVVSNSRAALRLAELARDAGRHEAMHDRLMDAYWGEAQNIGDPDVLRTLASEVGLASEEVERVLAGDDYLERVERSTRRAVAAGVTGVPAFVLDNRLLVLGAHPRETFKEAFRRLEAA